MYLRESKSNPRHQARGAVVVVVTVGAASECLRGRRQILLRNENVADRPHARPIRRRVLESLILTRHSSLPRLRKTQPSSDK